MLFRQKIFAVSAALFLLVLIFELVRRRKLKEEYSWLWLLTGASILMLTLWYDLLLVLTSLIGAVTATTTLFISAVMYLVLITLHFSVRISTLTDQVKKLAQELAILKGKQKNQS